jgi:hypothetical protein
VAFLRKVSVVNLSVNLKCLIYGKFSEQEINALILTSCIYVL